MGSCGSKKRAERRARSRMEMEAKTEATVASRVATGGVRSYEEGAEAVEDDGFVRVIADEPLTDALFPPETRELQKNLRLVWKRDGPGEAAAALVGAAFPVDLKFVLLPPSKRAALAPHKRRFPAPVAASPASLQPPVAKPRPHLPAPAARAASARTSKKRGTKRKGLSFLKLRRKKRPEHALDPRPDHHRAPDPAVSHDSNRAPSKKPA